MIVASLVGERHNQRVLEMIVVLVRALALACRGQHELVLENLAVHQQLNAMRRTHPSAATETRPAVLDRILTDVAALATTLVFVQPETVVRWLASDVRNDAFS